MGTTMRYLKLRSSQEKLNMKKRARAQDALFQRELNKMIGGQGFTEIPAPNEKAKQLRKQLTLFLYVFAVNLVFKFVVGFFPLQDVFSAILLWCGKNSLNYCYVSFFVMMTFFAPRAVVVIQ